MINKEKGELFIECEDCGNKEYGGTIDDFMKFWEDKKREGWRARKVEDKWKHDCPTCVSQ